MGYFLEALEKLQDATRDCRVNMHEPDEQGITAEVTGSILDNAGVSGELTVIIFRDNRPAAVINLASLIALARVADLSKMK